MLKFTADNKQSATLSSLAYWIADTQYIIERSGLDDPELTKCHDTIMMIFDKLDALSVPYWVQNDVICWAEDWRRYKSEYIRSAMKSKNIFI